MYRSSVIKSIQSGTIDLAGVTSATATVTAVVLANAVLLYNGRSNNNAAATSAAGYPRLTLTNTTTVTATRNTAQAGAMPVAWVLIEYYPNILKSCQYGTVSLGAGTSATATITSVDTTKAHVINLGWSSSSVAVMDATFEVKQVLTNATTVTATSNTANNATTTSFVVVEFY